MIHRSMFPVHDEWFSLPKATCVIVLAVLPGLITCSGSPSSEDRKKARALLESESFAQPLVVNSTVDEERFRRMAALTLKANRKRPYVLRELVQHYKAQKNWQRALEYLNELIELQPLDSRWYLKRGQILGERFDSDRDLEQAQNAFRTAIRLGEDPASSVTLEARYGLGLLLAFRLDRKQQGAQQLRRVLDARETVQNRMVHKEARFALGRLAYEEADWNGARNHFRSAALMKGIPSESRFRALENLARTLRKLQRNQRAQTVRRMAKAVKRRELSLPELERRLDTPSN